MSEDSCEQRNFGRENERFSAEEMDERRQQNIAYEYLCHLEEAKIWMETCLQEELPPTTELEEYLRNGVCLAKLGNFFAPKVVPLRKIYDVTLTRYEKRGLHFRHTDNIHHWLAAVQSIGLPEAIVPETTDVYDKKNMPRVVYCLHALSLFLFKLGLAPEIQNLYGKVNFTEEEISAMRRELEKYGIQMPAFGTIGGILENEIPVDEAAMHAAIMAINETIEKQDTKELLVVLQNPSALLHEVKPSSIDHYQDILARTKWEKVENTKNRALSSQESHDVYDEMLTRTEIQHCLNSVNCEVTLQSIKESLDNQNCVALLKVLNTNYLGFKNVLPKNAELYMEELLKLDECKQDNNNEIIFTKDNVQEAIHNANELGDIMESRNYAMKVINDAIEQGNSQALLTALKSPDAQLTAVVDSAADLYLLEFANIRQENGTDLKYEELNGGIIVLSAVAMVNLCVEAGNPDGTYEALVDENVHLVGVDSDCKLRYQTMLYEAKRRKSKNTSEISLLTHLELQECIIIANREAQEEHDRITSIQDINDALKMDDPQITFDALRNLAAELRDIHSANPILYHHMLQRERAYKAAGLDDADEDPSLWVDEIQLVIDKSNRLAQVARKCCEAIAEINIAIDEKNREEFEVGILNPDAQLLNIVSACMESYFSALSSHKKEKLDAGYEDSTWIEYRTKEGISLIYNWKTEEAHWTPTRGEPTMCLCKEEIQSILSSVTSEYDRQLLYKEMEPRIVQFQALVRGYLRRRVYKERLDYLNSQKDYAVKIQAWWRGCKQRRNYRNRLQYLKSSINLIVKVQSVVRRFLAIRKYRARLDYFKANVTAIIKIQTCWRASKTRKAFQDLRNSDTPSFQSVQMFVHLLDINNLDFSEELESNHLKGEVVKTIRHNQQLEKDLVTMDIKIGLLVKNRITLQDVAAHGSKLDRKSKEGQESAYGTASQRGLKSLSKDSRQKVEAYQHLFYLVQTNPRYLSHLVTFMLPSAKTKFIESIVLTLFNYASNQREEYLLLKLFKAALQEEISSRVDQPSDITTANSLIIKMIVGFNRNKRGKSSLREILGPMIKQLLDNKKLQINTNPVDVYKTWVNQLETKTGEPSGLPYNVSQDEALKQEEVVQQIKESVTRLKETTLLFFNTIVNSIDKLPYGILYMAKVLKNSLENKFPDAPNKEILKIVGNLLYYRYINSAIVAPDGFDIVDVAATQALNSDQRRNLGSIAKILQFATSKTGFGDESPHLVCLNPFIIECHEKFKEFFQAACEVEELEEHFKIDEYSEATMMTKPVIYISLQDICDLHQLLLEHEGPLAPDPEDPLHELLEDLGAKPSVEALIGESLDNLSSIQLSKTEVCLTLTNKFEVPDSTKTEVNRLFVRTKQMIVDAMHCMEVNDIPSMLTSNINDIQKQKYILLMDKRLKQNASVEKDKKMLCRTTSDSERFTLDEVMDKISHNLNLLELEGFVSSKNEYQDIVNAIALDIRNKRRYRLRRKQDLVHLKTTLSNLQTKKSFFEDQVDYYNQYIKQCRDNMATGKKKLRRRSTFLTRSFHNKAALKYTAAKLHDKGIIKSMEGLTANQYKNVLFEITPTDVSGVFTVKVKYMGTSLSDVELDIQNLLELQYDGVSVMTMFNHAEINVNLLLHLLNSKFYGKT